MKELIEFVKNEDGSYTAWLKRVNGIIVQGKDKEDCVKEIIISLTVLNKYLQSKVE